MHIDYIQCTFHVYKDQLFVIKNTSMPEAMLKRSKVLLPAIMSGLNVQPILLKSAVN